MDRKNTYITIMAGGVGSRFWPASRTDMPKQFLDILGTGKSLIRATFERFLPLASAENILILTNERYRDLVKEHLPEVLDTNILCEPSMNNTAPAIAYAALRLKKMNPKAVFIVAPSDHIILKSSIFIEKASLALNYANENDALLTLGIQPSRPDTGYGYIDTNNVVDSYPEGDVLKVNRFVEKPDRKTAINYIEAGHYLWNAGIFVWSVQSILKAFENYTQGIISVLNEKSNLIGTDDEQEYINEIYPQTEKISIDYAILEKAPNVFTIPSDIGWSDLGTWNSLHAYSNKDENENVIQGSQFLIQDTTNSLIRVPKKKKVVIRGLDNYIIIDEGDVLLIYPKSKEQEIKEVKRAIDNA